MCLEVLKNHPVIGESQVAHLERAIPKEEYLELLKDNHIIIGHENNTITFKIQDGPIKENGVNGCQVEALLWAFSDILSQFQTTHFCTENMNAITHVQAAITEMINRKANREQRGIEGTNQV